jgi:hypothetical protein
MTYDLLPLPTPLFGLSITTGDGLRIPPPHVALLQCLTCKDNAIDVVEIAAVTVVAGIIGIAASYALNHYWIHDICRRLKITRRFGQPNVWSFALDTKEVQWATVRDLQNHLMFQGYIRAFSDVEDQAEIFLTQVCVYNETTGEKLYEADRMYLARDKSNLTVEFPDL